MREAYRDDAALNHGSIECFSPILVGPRGIPSGTTLLVPFVTYDEFDEFCSSLPATAMVIQWGNSRVWKVGGKAGGKVFAIGGWSEDACAFTFKVDEETYDFLRGQSGLRPAPYFASRGMKWIQHYAEPGLADDPLRDSIVRSHYLASLGLTKKKQREFGLNQ